MMLLRFIDGNRSVESLNKLIEPSRTSPELLLQKKYEIKFLIFDRMPMTRFSLAVN